MLFIHLKNVEMLTRFLSTVLALRLLAGILAYCPAGLMPPDCQLRCTSGKYGINCASFCPATCMNRSCRPESGTCIRCLPGYSGPKCSAKCRSGFYGQDCKNGCPQNCFDNRCDAFTGFCDRCLHGYKGSICEDLDTFLNPNKSANARTMYDQIMKTGTSGVVVISIVMVLFLCTLPLSAIFLCVNFSNKNLQRNRLLYERTLKQRQSRLFEKRPGSRLGFLSSRYNKMPTIYEECGSESTDEKRESAKEHSTASASRASSILRGSVEAQKVNETRSETFQNSPVNLRTDDTILRVVDENMTEGALDLLDCAPAVDVRTSREALPVLAANNVSGEPRGKDLRSSSSKQNSEHVNSDQKTIVTEERLCRKCFQTWLSGDDKLQYPKLVSSQLQKTDENFSNQDNSTCISKTNEATTYTPRILENGSRSASKSPDVGSSFATRYADTRSNVKDDEGRQCEMELQPMQRQEMCLEVKVPEATKTPWKSNPNVNSADRKPTLESGLHNANQGALPVEVEGDNMRGASSWDFDEAVVREKNISKMRRLVEALKLEKMLAVTMKSLQPYVYNYPDVDYNLCQDAAVEMDVVAAQLERGAPVTLDSVQNPCTLDNLAIIQEGQNSTASAVCVGLNPADCEGEEGLKLVERQRKDYVCETAPGNRDKQPDPLPYPISLVGKVGGSDISSYVFGMSTHEWQQLQTFEYAQLNFRTVEETGVLRELTPEDINFKEVSEESYQISDNCKVPQPHDSTDNSEQSVQSPANDGNMPNTSFSVNGTANNTNYIQPTPKFPYHYPLSPSSILNFDLIVPRHNSSASQQRITHLSKSSFAGRSTLPLFSITNSAPTSLTISYGLGRSSVHGIPYHGHPSACYGPVPAYRIDKHVANPKRPVLISSSSSSPPRVSQNSSTDTTTASGHDTGKRYFRSPKTIRPDRKFAIRTDKSALSFQKAPYARCGRRLKGTTSPSHVYFRQKSKESSFRDLETKQRNTLARSKTRHSTRSGGHASFCSSDEDSITPRTCLSVSQIQDENPLGGSRSPDHVSVIPKSVITMTVTKTPSQEVKTICTTCHCEDIPPGNRYQESVEDVPKSRLLTRLTNKATFVRADLHGQESFPDKENDRQCKREGVTFQIQPQNKANLYHRPLERDNSCRINRPSRAVVQKSKASLGLAKFGKQNRSQTASSSTMCSSNSRGEANLFHKKDHLKRHDWSEMERNTKTVFSSAGSGRAANKEKSIQTYPGGRLLDDSQSSVKFFVEHKLKGVTFIKDKQSDKAGRAVASKAVQTAHEEREEIPRRRREYQSERALRFQGNETGLTSPEDSSPSKTRENSVQTSSPVKNNETARLIAPGQDLKFQNLNAVPVIGVYPLPSLLEGFLTREIAASACTGSRTMTRCIPTGSHEASAAPSFTDDQEASSSKNEQTSSRDENWHPNQQRPEMGTESICESDNSLQNGQRLNQKQRHDTREVYEKDEDSQQFLEKVVSRRNDGFSKPKSRPRDYCRCPAPNVDSPSAEANPNRDDSEQFYDALESTNNSLLPRSSRHQQGPSENQGRLLKDRKHVVKFDSQTRKKVADDCNISQKNNDEVRMKLNVSKDFKTQRLVCDLTGNTTSERLIAFRFAPHCKSHFETTPDSTTLERSSKRKSSREKKTGISIQFPPKQASELVRKSTKLRWANAVSEEPERSSASGLLQKSQVYYRPDMRESVSSIGGSGDEKDSTVFNSLPSGKESIYGDILCSKGEDFCSLKDS